VACFITFLTDFGLQDDFVGTCHGVIKRIAPEVEIIDITHGIPPQGVLQGALTLANTLPFMPAGVHLAVVDPGVGGARRALALRDGEGRSSRSTASGTCS
jgi:S-adenosylmethionine hydrolase